MASTSFTNGVTLTDAAWFNDINDGIYKGVGTTGYSTVASATTPDIFATTISGRINYTGTTTCTGFVAAPSAGATRQLVCSGAAVFTAGANMLIDGVTSGNNLTCSANDIVRVVAVSTTQFRLSRDAYAGVSATITRAHLSGLTLSTAGSSATMSIAAGQCADSTNATYINLSATSKTTSAFSAGSGNGGIDTGAIANSTWYHFYAISKTDGTADVCFSLSASAPTLPSGYTYYRRMGSGKTNGSAQWVLFTQDGDYFRWSASVADVSSTNPGTAAVTLTLASVPTGVNVQAIFNSFQASGATSSLAYFSDLSAADEAVSSSATPFGNIGTNSSGFAVGNQFQIRTNTSAQIRFRSLQSDGSRVNNVATLGWIDRRGRDA